MRIDVITLFPELVEQVIACGVVGRAAEQKLLELHCWNPRDYTRDRHRTVDDRPYGGGPGMLMKVQPLEDTIAAGVSEPAGTAARSAQAGAPGRAGIGGFFMRPLRRCRRAFDRARSG
jgi:tRNA (guanine37-N1)-methyltransferase